MKSQVNAVYEGPVPFSVAEPFVLNGTEPSLASVKTVKRRANWKKSRSDASSDFYAMLFPVFKIKVPHVAVVNA